MAITAAEHSAMQRALTLAAAATVPHGPNPRVGCVLLNAEGAVVGEGWHRGAGSAHAEADALARLAPGTRPHTAVVTLEPCNHLGRTGPCSLALHTAGVQRVVVALADPHPKAAGGAEWLRHHGVEVELATGDVAEAAAQLNRGWLTGIGLGRPWVTWKCAATIDGFSAAMDGTSQWITSPEARADAHAMRARHDGIVVGTQTVVADDPALTVRNAAGEEAPVQPRPVVVGLRDLDPAARVLHGPVPALLCETRDPREALATMFEAGLRDVFLEGGPTLAAAFVREGLVDELVVYIAPTLLGGGLRAIGDLGIQTLSDASRWQLSDLSQVGPDARLTLHPPTRRA